MRRPASLCSFSSPRCSSIVLRATPRASIEFPMTPMSREGVLDRAVDTSDGAENGKQQRSEQQVVLGDISGNSRHGRVHWSRE